MRHLSVSYSGQEILKAISEIFLRNGEWYDADVTYSKGVFWDGLKPPKYCSDLIPQAPNVTQDDSTVLSTYTSGSLRSVVFDPPFLFRDRKAANNDKMCKRFSYFKTYDELMEMYTKSMDSIRRVLIPKGFLVFKCQDMTDGRFYCTHNKAINYATSNGYTLKDIVLKVSKTKLQRDAKQQNCVAKVHSYFLILQKDKEAAHE